MPLFNEASRIYHPLEINFMRSCFSHAAIMLEESDQGYSAADLTSYIIMLYQSGLRDQSYICEIAARLAHQRFKRRHAIERYTANNKGPTRTARAQPVEYDPLA
ncbi:hypothetical protein FHW20_004493 [Ochrobactrum intermedium]|uniref:DUF982 domain-containing protein n=1 Tax=Brucella intermedia TaxID=94625 RepID=A0ABR6AVL9_9HYPH|nr:hypothetical protein [Brucella intermedia]MBA8853511.1 hypothetical protein [Brucella intermedia]MPR64730.1 hypothetical protein [Brucella intermedia]